MLVFPEDANSFKIRLNINTKQFTFNIVVNRVLNNTTHYVTGTEYTSANLPQFNFTRQAFYTFGVCYIWEGYFYFQSPSIRFL